MLPFSPNSILAFASAFTTRRDGAALFVSRPSKVPFIKNKISLIEFAREKVA